MLCWAWQGLQTCQIYAEPTWQQQGRHTLTKLESKEPLTRLAWSTKLGRWALFFCTPALPEQRSVSRLNCKT